MTSELQRQARDFAVDIQRTLNRTITRDVRMAAVQHPMRDSLQAFSIGSGLSRTNLTDPEPFGLRVDGKLPHAWMSLSFQVRMDAEKKYLMVHKSYVAIFADAEGDKCLCHFDYERGKEQYTDAHLQVHGHSPALDKLNRKGDEKRPLDKVHFPVGGKRYRPSIEDIIEFLIAERVIDGKPGWEEVVEAGRADFQRRQLRAAMRRDPETVKAWVAEQDRFKSKP